MSSWVVLGAMVLLSIINLVAFSLKRISFDQSMVLAEGISLGIFIFLSLVAMGVVSR